MDRHRLAEERSLAAHRIIASRIQADPTLTEKARAWIAASAEAGAVARSYEREWARILALPVAEIVAVLLDPSEHGRALRQVTPFAGVLSPQERWRLWDEVREAMERAG